jgi:phospholipid N-methyltransferase
LEVGSWIPSLSVVFEKMESLIMTQERKKMLEVGSTKTKEKVGSWKRITKSQKI